jgi:hypothetical protein
MICRVTDGRTSCNRGVLTRQAGSATKGSDAVFPIDLARKESVVREIYDRAFRALGLLA